MLIRLRADASVASTDLLQNLTVSDLLHSAVLAGVNVEPVESPSASKTLVSVRREG